MDDLYWGGSYWADSYWAGSYWGKVTTIVLTPTPDCRIYIIIAEGRTLLIATEDRNHEILTENRTLSVMQCTDDD